MKIKYSYRARVKYPTAEIYCVICHKLQNKEDLHFGCNRCAYKAIGHDLLTGDNIQDYQISANNFRIFNGLEVIDYTNFRKALKN